MSRMTFCSALACQLRVSGFVPRLRPGAPLQYSTPSRLLTVIRGGDRSPEPHHDHRMSTVTRPSWVPHPDSLKYGHRRVSALDGGGIRGILLDRCSCGKEPVALTVLGHQLFDSAKLWTLYSFTLWSCSGVFGGHHLGGLEGPESGEQIERKDIYLADFFDIIAGTSTGGLLALYLASRGKTHDFLGDKGPLGLKGADRAKREGGNDSTYFRKGGVTAALQMYRANASTIFQYNVPGIIRWIPGIEQANDAFISCRYGWRGIESVLQSVFGNDLGSKESPMLTLTDLSTLVVIPSFNIKEISPFTFFYNSYPDCTRPGFTFVGKDPDPRWGGTDELCTFTANFPLWQVARATSAAPTFFPVAIVQHVGDAPKNEHNVKAPIEPLELIDGGVAANDPAFQAVLLQGKMYGASMKKDAPKKAIKWLLPSDFAILSLGTGTIKSAAHQGHGAQLSLVGDLVGKVLMGSASDLVHSYFKAMTANLPAGTDDTPEKERSPPCPYLRIQKTDTSTDDPDEMEKLERDVLRRPATPDERRRYMSCLNVMDDVSDENMDMLEHIGEYLGRVFTEMVVEDGQKKRTRNMLYDYVEH